MGPPAEMLTALGHHLASVRLCEFRVPGLPYGGAITRAIGYDAAGFRCPVPAVNTSLFVGYDRGSVSQRVTLRLSEDGDTFFDSGVEFVYFRQPVLMGAHPLYGPLTGGSTVIYGMGLHAVLADPSAARCKLGGLITPVRAIAPNGEHLTCDLPPLPDGFVLGAGYSLAVAINGVTFIDDARVRTFSYYTPPANASLQPVSGATEAQTEVTVYAAGLLVDTEKTEPRCRFGSAGTSAAEIVTVASTDPLRPELFHIERRFENRPWGVDGIRWTGFFAVEWPYRLNESGKDLTLIVDTARLQRNVQGHLLRILNGNRRPPTSSRLDLVDNPFASAPTVTSLTIHPEDSVKMIQMATDGGGLGRFFF